ncbi:MAG TPA: enoyl-CoA hydratase-related protein [Acidimicrobiales bacterium]|nr:enoyl-CoA hydratase-related protein [Acidimicrobiales bacterium]
METVHVARTGGVVTVTLNRPERKNALTTAMIEELRVTFDDVAHHPEDRVLVLTGAGDDFCSGADLSGPGRPSLEDPAAALEGVRRVGELARSLHGLGKPSIARVDGVAVGAGLGLAIGCDLVLAADRARFSTIFARRALSPDCGTSWLLPRLVGAAKAKELAYFADVVDADTARSVGLVNRVVPHEELDTVVGEWALRLAEGPSLALSTTKSLLDSAWSSSLDDALEHEAQCQAQNLTGADVKEAIAAFLEKRPAHYGPR